MFPRATLLRSAGAGQGGGRPSEHDRSGVTGRHDPGSRLLPLSSHETDVIVYSFFVRKAGTRMEGYPGDLAAPHQPFRSPVPCRTNGAIDEIAQVQKSCLT